jgi:hypothetical protein
MKPPKKVSLSGNLYAEGVGRNINAGASGVAKKGNTSVNAGINVGPGYNSLDLGVTQRIKNNLNLSVGIGSGGSYNIGASLKIPIGSKLKKK